ncbi:flagellar basal body-associated protein FliL [Bradyrhizobium sp. U87765 SZCCT0131]|uniref:flagellar basal body-associated protein FliL n=1 Tax=unclassified Bradyrhizobium TaxID=2631580 RepID=UPI001BA78A0C|nr:MULTISPECIES: flagellar basal body-associated protein FliL [unclassified Bradyrhizobium]MBR1219760.1 flagellar basal body-associated protein FliL [Bradyrhizobium sp. U87765 SZCCT0131]MBR1262411.1 flagellar basal body-associated protein FliL [Bradyrhizobium sp. U87765 SZCCT0134]MBR1308406.1 flagellar basal body-associated protein FliL [Bradyrhizobium sp. U87765 SZCCT0110]MBR1318193.1 flagellar basal body-associated protein FliL [Bradyrhizobium sp. U87765 SZCCT0109]MBR1351896.1 flagellar basa
MADDQPEDGAGEGSATPKSKFKLIVAVVGVFVVLSGGAASYFLFMRPKAEEKHAEAPAPKPPVFVDVPEVLVNLSSLPGERVQYLKVKIALEVKDQPVVAQITPAMPRVQDIFQTYMRELRASDLSGSAGMFRLKEELTRRVNAAVQPAQVNAVLFKEIVVQ